MFKVTQFAAIAMSLMFGGSSVHAEKFNLPELKFDTSRVYFVALGDRFLPYGTALFCPVKEAAFKGCKKREGYSVGRSFQARGSNRTDPNFSVDSLKFTASGRFALYSATSGNRHITPETITYYFDARPGTVFVLGTPKMDAKLAVAHASRILTEQFGEQFSQLKYLHMDAGKVVCANKGFSKRVCALGKQVDLKSVGQTYN